MLLNFNSINISFGQFVWIWNKQQGSYTPKIHQKIIDWLNYSRNNNIRRLLLLIFRGAGKSTICALYCAWLVIKLPNIRILIVSGEEKLASKLTGNIKKILETHLFSRQHVRKERGSWAKKEFTIARSIISRDPSVIARGISANITGYRADLIICDDVEVPNNCNNSIKREELRRKLADLNLILSPGGTILYLGTPHTFESIYIRNISQRQQPPAYLEHYACLNIPIINQDNSSAWPERFPVEIINEIRSEIGQIAFDAQMMVRPKSMSDVHLVPEKFYTYDPAKVVLEESGKKVIKIAGQKIIGDCCFWDVSFGRKDRGDKCVLAHVLLDENRNFYINVLSYLYSHHEEIGASDELTILSDQVIDIAFDSGIERIFIENNGIGHFVPSFVRSRLIKKGYPIQVIAHHTKDAKVQRILSVLDPLLAAGRLWINEEAMRTPFFQEMRLWRPQRSSNDDGLDAVASCIQLMPKGLVQNKFTSVLQSQFEFQIL